MRMAENANVRLLRTWLSPPFPDRVSTSKFMKTRNTDGKFLSGKVVFTAVIEEFQNRIKTTRYDSESQI